MQERPGGGLAAVQEDWWPKTGFGSDMSDGSVTTGAIPRSVPQPGCESRTVFILVCADWLSLFAVTVRCHYWQPLLALTTGSRY